MCLQLHMNVPDASFCLLVLGEKAYEKLSSWIISGFPTPTTPDITNSLSMKLLQRLSASLLFAEYPSAADAPPELAGFWRKVELSFKTLRDLEASTRNLRIGDTIPPTNSKRGKTVTRRSQVDLLSSDPLAMNVPTNDTEVREARAEILSELRGILEVCESRLMPTRGAHPP